MERVVIFGSTGTTGICTVEAAVNKGKKMPILLVKCYLIS